MATSDDTRRTFQREVRIGLTVLGVLGAMFVGLAIWRFMPKSSDGDLAARAASAQSPAEPRAAEADDAATSQVVVPEARAASRRSSRVDLAEWKAPASASRRPDTDGPTLPSLDAAPSMPRIITAAPTPAPDAGYALADSGAVASEPRRLDLAEPPTSGETDRVTAYPPAEPATLSPVDAAPMMRDPLAPATPAGYGSTASAAPPQPRDIAPPSGLPARGAAASPGAATAGGGGYGGGYSAPAAPAPSGFGRPASGGLAGGRGGFAAMQSGRRDDGTYEVQPNETYWSICEKLYGSGAYFKALAEHNRKTVPLEDQLKPGQTIVAPDVAQLEKKYPALCPKPEHRDAQRRKTSTIVNTAARGGRVYVTQEGDTLFEVARHELGKASRWVEIYELNREQIGPDYNYLPPGIQLTMPQPQPDRDRPDTLTRRPGGTTLRR